MPSVKITNTISECRLYSSDNPLIDEPYQAAFNILWLKHEPGAIYISMLMSNGKLTRSLLRELIKELKSKGVHTVYALRTEGHVLPRAELLSGNTWKLDLTKF